jgi:nucleoside-diphosphate-sugar epimerase
MRILITGSSGFIGRRVVAALLNAGHQVVCVVRSVPATPERAGMQFIEADFTRDPTPESWAPRLRGIDIVINAVGIIREHGAQTFSVLHSQAPRALFAACARQGVKLIVQISALGADRHAISRYHLSKKEADDFLLENNLPAIILQPSLVYGPGGASAALFNTLATLPVQPVFGDGRQMVQPVHIDDVVDAVLAAVNMPNARGERIAVVGADAVPFARFIAMLRSAMRMRPAWRLTVPIGIARLTARVAGIVGNAPLDSETFQMLERGNTADVAGLRALLGRMPRGIAQFISPEEAAMVRCTAQQHWLLPMLRVSIALVWIATGIISAFVYPVEDSYTLLKRVGIPAVLMPLMLYGAAALDLVLGVAILFVRRKWIWALQLVVIVFYSLVIAWRLPEFLWHPYGPILKNLPMLAAILLLMANEER